MATRIVLVDDHPIVLSGLRQLFAHQPGFTVAACCASAEEAVAAVRAERPDVLVLDLRMPGRNGLHVLHAIGSPKPACGTVLLTAAISDEEVVEAVRLGVRGIVLKESPPETLIECVRRVHAGEQWIDRDTLTRAFDTVVRQGEAPKGGPLTPREIEIVRMVAEGLRNRAIAGRMGIAEGTVKVHLHNIYEKVGVDGRLELVVCAREQKLI